MARGSRTKDFVGYKKHDLRERLASIRSWIQCFWNLCPAGTVASSKALLRFKWFRSWESWHLAFHFSSSLQGTTSWTYSVYSASTRDLKISASTHVCHTTLKWHYIFAFCEMLNIDIDIIMNTSYRNVYLIITFLDDTSCCDFNMEINIDFLLLTGN